MSTVLYSIIKISKSFIYFENNSLTLGGVWKCLEGLWPPNVLPDLRLWWVRTFRTSFAMSIMISRPISRKTVSCSETMFVSFYYCGAVHALKRLLGIFSCYYNNFVPWNGSLLFLFIMCDNFYTCVKLIIWCRGELSLRGGDSRGIYTPPLVRGNTTSKQ